jgi:hypothetical protein
MVRNGKGGTVGREKLETFFIDLFCICRPSGRVWIYGTNKNE